MKPFIIVVLSFVFCALLDVRPADAHPHHGPAEHATQGFHDGWLHPWTGLDHLLGIAVVGFLATQVPTKFGILLPIVYCAGLLVLHGSQLGNGAQAAGYLTGLAAITLLLTAGGVAAGCLLNHLRWRRRIAGVVGHQTGD